MSDLLAPQDDTPALTWGRIVAGVAVCVLVFFITLYAAVNRASADPSDLARRCATSHPEWQSYQEDIKGQIGAAAAAEWHGTLQRFEISGREARLTFLLEGPWAAYACGIPILLRDPLGNVVQSTDISAPAPERTYRFQLPAESLPPWVEVHIPHEERRLPLSPEGTWASAS